MPATRDKPKQSSDKQVRVCARPRCKTILSRYNTSPLCWACGGGYETPELSLAELMAEKAVSDYGLILSALILATAIILHGVLT